MAKETEKNVTDVTEQNVTVTEQETTEVGLELFVERVPAKDRYGKFVKTKAGEQLYNYILPVSLRGRNSKVDFSTADKGGFEPLDNVFYGTDKAELIISQIETEFNGKKTSRTVYTVRNIDAEGEWSCEVKPARKSDLDLLNQHLSVLSKRKA